MVRVPVLQSNHNVPSTMSSRVLWAAACHIALPGEKCSLGDNGIVWIMDTGCDLVCLLSMLDTEKGA